MSMTIPGVKSFIFGWAWHTTATTSAKKCESGVSKKLLATTTIASFLVHSNRCEFATISSAYECLVANDRSSTEKCLYFGDKNNRLKKNNRR